MIWLFSLAFGYCSPDPIKELTRTIDAVEDALKILDEPAIDRESANMLDAVGCLETRIERGLAARLHRMQALSFFAVEDDDSTRRSLAAAKFLDANSPWISEWFPVGHPFQVFWDEVGPFSAEAYSLGTLSSRQWIVDGVPATEAPVDRAYVLQVEGDDGVSWSGYINKPEQIPKKGQVFDHGPAKPLQVFQATVGVGAGLASAEQTSMSSGWESSAQTAALFSGNLDAEWSPTRWYGLMARAAADFGNSGGLGGELHNSLRARGGDVHQRFLGFQVGIHYGQQTATFSNDDVQLSGFVGPLLGVEAGLESKRGRGTVQLQSHLIGWVPRKTSIQARYQRKLGETLTFGGRVFGDYQGISYLDESDRPAGKVANLSVGLAAELGLWFN